MLFVFVKIFVVLVAMLVVFVAMLVVFVAMLLVFVAMLLAFVVIRPDKLFICVWTVLPDISLKYDVFVKLFNGIEL